MNRRGFLRSLMASTATIVVAPACVLEELPPIGSPPIRTYVDMGRNAPLWPDFNDIFDERRTQLLTHPTMQMLVTAAAGYVARNYGPGRGPQSLLRSLLDGPEL